MRYILSFLTLMIPSMLMADVQACQQLYTNGPKTLGGYRMTEGLNFEAQNKGYGFMLKYVRSNNDAISVVFYDNGKKHVSNDLALQELVATAKLVTTRLNNGQEPPEPLGLYELSKFQALYAMAVMYGPSSAGNNFAATGVANNCLVKLRYTTGGNLNRADSKFQRILGELDVYLLR